MFEVGLVAVAFVLGVIVDRTVANGQFGHLIEAERKMKDIWEAKANQYMGFIKGDSATISSLRAEVSQLRKINETKLRHLSKVPPPVPRKK